MAEGDDVSVNVAVATIVTRVGRIALLCAGGSCDDRLVIVTRCGDHFGLEIIAA